jgi:hypothetical protein
MIRHAIIGLTVLLAAPVCAQQNTFSTDTIINPDGSYTVHTQSIAHGTSTKYAAKHWQISKWNAHWFATLQAGATMYMGQEDSKGDFGKRITPLYEISVGKWIYPYLGARVSFGQGNLTGFSTKKYEQIGEGLLPRASRPSSKCQR